MTIAPIGPLGPILPPLPGMSVPITNIQPFTYRDGATYLDILHGMDAWIKKTLIPYIETNLTTIGNEIIDAGNIVIQELQTAIDNTAHDFDDKVQEVNALIDQINTLVTQINASATAAAASASAAANSATAAGTSETNAATSAASALNSYNESLAIANGMLPVPVATFGAVGDGTTDDTAAILAAITDGRPIHFGKNLVYRITAQLTLNAAQPLYWYSAGSKILLDPPAPVQYGVLINHNTDVYITGQLVIDANRKAFTGIAFKNNSTTDCKLYASNLTITNNYRSSQTFASGGDGIYIAGAYSDIFLEAPTVLNSLMATGAGVAGSYGVGGITIDHQNANYPKEITILHPHIENVYCEDNTYLTDQDGIRIFTAEDDGTTTDLYRTHFNIIGGVIRNCRGRTLKSQAEFGRISGTKIERDGVANAALNMIGVAPEIDFQVGGGMVSDVDYQYHAAFPSCLVNWSGSRQATPKLSTGITIRGVKVSMKQSSTVYLAKAFQFTMQQQLNVTANISDVEIINPSFPIQGDLITVTPNSQDGEFVLNINNFSAPSDGAYNVVKRLSTSAMQVYASIGNLYNNRATKTAATIPAALLTGAVTGQLTLVTHGQFIRMPTV